MDDAGAALRGVAADMGAGQPQILAQQLHQQRARIDVGGDGFAVHREGNGCHMRLLGFPKKRCLRTARGRFPHSKSEKRDDFSRFSTLEPELV